MGDAGRGGEGSQEREGIAGGENIAGDENSQRKDPAGVGQVVVAGAAVVVNGNAGFGEQAKVPVESAEAAPAGKGPGTPTRAGTSRRTWRIWKRSSGAVSAAK